jgi:gliding motility-associated-like protein
MCFSHAQGDIVISISSGGVYEIDCESGDTFLFTDDNNGLTDAQEPYSDQNYSITLCPSTPGDGIVVDFILVDLETNFNPNNNDFLQIYQGDAIDPDTYAGVVSSVQTDVQASIFNETGCITFNWIVNNGAGDGNVGWIGVVTCETPCSTPEAGLELVSPDPFVDNPISVGVCPGEEVFFDASSSMAGAPEFPLDSIIWNWGDGLFEVTSVDDGFELGHEYNTPGEYIVSVAVQDINNCNSVNLDPYQVLVSTIPIFNTEITSPLCEDVPGTLNGNPVQSVTWTALPPIGVSELADLPDATGATFTSELFIDFFNPDQVLLECDDIEMITANIEHSFVGDLTMSVVCPNGTEVILMENGPSGGNDPNDCNPLDELGNTEDLNGNALGVVDVEGWDYSWNMDAEYILDGSDNPEVEFGAIPSGTYLPCGDLCDFEGCPLNGVWTFNVIDQWLSDNGTLFSWGIDFNPEIVPGVTTFTPAIGLDLDSSFWHPVGDLGSVLSSSDYGVTNVSDDGNYADVLFPDPGTFDFGYVVTNSFGCTWDTTLTVQVIDNPGAFISAGPDQIFCGAPVTLQGSLDGGGGSACGGDAGSFELCLGNGVFETYTYCPDVPGDGTVMSLNFSGGFLETCCDFMTIYDGADNTAPVLTTTNGDFTGQAFTATNPDGCLTIEITSDGSVSCESGNFDPLSFCVTCTGGTDVCSYDWSWSPDEFLADPTSPTPTVLDFDGTPTEYTLSVEPVGFDNCAAEATVMVVPGFNYEVEQQQPSCFANDGVIGVEIFEDALAPEGPFTIELYTNEPAGPVLMDELVWDNITDFYYDDLVPGDYTVVVYDDVGCIYNQEIVLEDPLPLSLNVPSNQTICLGGIATLEVDSDDDPLNVWTYEWDNGLPNGNAQQVSPNTSTVYTVQAFDLNGCPTPSYSVGVNVLDAINADLVADDFLCSGEEAFLDAGASNGGSGSGYTYTWTFEGGLLNEDDPNIFTFPPSSGTYCVTVGDDCETPPGTTCTEVVLESPVPISFSADTTEACGTGTFLFTNETDPASISSTLWAFGDGTYAGESNTVKTFENPGFYDVGVTVTSQAGGCEYTLVQEAYINVYPIPDVGYFAGPQPTRAPDTEITFDGYSNANVVEWLWTFNVFDPLGTSTEQDPVFQFPNGSGGTYPVQLQITDAQGCVNVVTRDVVIQDFFNLYVPNTFTPNNDGTNDAFFVEGSDIDPDRFEFEVWNRWGELVWRTTDPEDAWYGQVGEEGQHFVPNGPYSYRLEVHSLDVESFRKEVFGVVTIIR